MRNFKLTKTILAVCFALFFMNAFSLSTNSYFTTVEKITDESSATGSVKDQLAAAQKNGNAVFLVITSNNAKGISELITLANQANKKVKKSTVIQMNRDDAANKELVTRYGVASIAVPFVLVISPKGMAVGGYPAKQATADLLIKLIPSPKYDEVLVAINAKKPIFIVADKKSFTDKATVLASCKAAAKTVAVTPAIVEVDLNDAREAAFLKQMGINTLSTKTVTVVVNSTGNITGTFNGEQPAKTLADAANKIVRKSCCPSGSKGGCGK